MNRLMETVNNAVKETVKNTMDETGKLERERKLRELMDSGFSVHEVREILD